MASDQLTMLLTTRLDRHIEDAHTMQAIETKYHGPTNTKGSRISARCGADRITMPRDHSLSIEDNHRRVAVALMLKLGWFGHWVSGSLPNTSGYVFVCSKLTNGVHEGFDVWEGMGK